MYRARNRKVTTCARVQAASGEKVVAVVPLVMPQLIQAFQMKYPNVEFVLHQGDNNSIPEWVRSGELILALSTKIHENAKDDAVFYRCIKIFIIYTLRNYGGSAIMVAQRVFCVYGEIAMDCKTKIRELREMTGMNRREFCECFDIPYRTVTEWELDNRHAPSYVLRLLEYYIRNEGLIQTPGDSAQTGERGSGYEETN